MKNALVKISFLLAVVVSICAPAGASAAVTGKVVAVLDGDTIDAQTQEQGRIRIRLNMIDAPEKDQPHGMAARSTLNRVLYGKSVTIDDSAGKDQYGRVIGTVYFHRENINEWLVLTGNAWEYKKYSTDPGLARAEARARKEKVGLWRKANPIPPWEWRHQDQNSAKSIAYPESKKIKAQAKQIADRAMGFLR